MKKRIFAVIMTIFILGSLVACSGQNSSLEKVSDESQGEKVLNMAIFWMDPNLEPTEGWNGWNLNRCGIGENLVQVDENMEFKPSIAESWEVVDPTTTVFKIREGVKFHNGNPVDAEACKNSIERALKITDREDAKFPLESIKAEGQELTIKTSKPFSTLLSTLADTVYIIVDSSVANEEDFKFAPIATGPFKVDEFTPDVGMTLSKNENHWSGEVGVDKVNVKCMPDASTRAMALQSGEIDLATQLEAKDLKLFEDKEDFTVQKGPNLRVFLLRINFRKPYMQKKEFRQALSYGIDKTTYAEKLVNGQAAKGPFTDSLPFAYTDEDYYSYDPEKANELLDKLGYMDTDGDGFREFQGKNIVLKYISATNHGADANNIGTAIQEQYKQIGIGMEIVQVENYTNMAESGDFDLLWERWSSAPTADPQYFFEASYKTDSAGNFGKYSNEDLDAICNRLDDTMDEEKRNQLGKEGSEELIKSVASLFLYYQEGNIVTRKNVEGVYRYPSEVYYIDERVRVN